jgi:predicted 3-demethylubiquinone-9 3-methyltransferase (glyoxalase superfamily)
VTRKTKTNDEAQIRAVIEEWADALRKKLSLFGLRTEVKEKAVMQKITPFLWFDHQAEEAAKFYTSIFKNSKVGRILRYGEEAAKISQSGHPMGSVLTIEFELEGQKFVALNGGPQFKFNESVSFVVNCETQQEVDYFWETLTADGGQESACGWLKDKFGVSWQVVPTVLTDTLHDKDSEKSERVMKAMLRMQKIDVEILKDAYAGG